MLLLVFRSAGEPYAVDAARVVEVVPRVALRAIPHAPAVVSGMFRYRGRVVPVIDLGVLLGDSASRPRLGTRIILVRAPTGDRDDALLGLAAEAVHELRSVRDEQRVFPPMTLEESPYLGAVYQLGDGLVQVLAVDRILAEPLREALFGARSEASR